MAVDLAIQGLTSLATPFIQPIFVHIVYWTLQSLATILSFWGNGDKSQDANGVYSSTFYQPGTYDFIVGLWDFLCCFKRKIFLKRL